MAHLLSVISGHGYGHAMQTCAVLTALHRLHPDIHLSIRTQVPRAFLRSRLDAPFDYSDEAVDFGMLMHSATTVDVAASARQYAEIHATWTQRVAAEQQRLEAVQPDLLFANVPYLSLAAAKQLGLPSMALCSLNWADIYWQYCAQEPGAAEIHAVMQSAYRSASLFLQPEPSMPMLDLPNRQALSPIAACGQAKSDALRQCLGLDADKRLVLVGLGGIPTELSMQHWPQRADIVWLIPGNWQVQRPDCFAFDSIDWRFIDLLASVDALITKPGYGSFTEAACHGIPVLYLSRRDWPESLYLQNWLHQHARCAEIQASDLHATRLLNTLDALWQTNAPPRPAANGAEQAARLIAEALIFNSPSP
jgi:hypothetical protein